MRTLDKQHKRVVVIYSVCMGLFHLYTAAFGLMEGLTQRCIHLGFALPLIFIYYPLRKSEDKTSKINPIDYLLVLLSLICVGYILFSHDYILNRINYIDPLRIPDLVLGFILVLLVLEATRRAVGLPLLLIALAFLFYGFWGHHVPGLFRHPPMSYESFIDIMYLSTNGIFGGPLAVCANYIYLFILFGAFLTLSGVGSFFGEFAISLTGRARGGQAKVSVISSGFFGMIAGSSTANVFATGSFTIPVMIKSGLKRHFAAAVEAAASCGGQFTPPIMGAAAFIMSEMTEIPYVTICKAAILPAFLYFAIMFVIIHQEALKYNLKPMPPEDIKPLKEVLLTKGHLCIPIIILIALLILNYTPYMAAFCSIVSIPIVAAINKNTRMGIGHFIEAFENGARNVLSIVGACAAAGMIMAMIVSTGFGFKFVSLVMAASGQAQFLALLLTAVTSLILGMGLPTAAAYVIVGALAAPALVKLGIPLLSAHMFVQFFACVSAITPPVALAAYAGAAVAKADIMKTAFSSTKLGVAAFILPFYFVYRPAIFIQGSFVEIIYVLFMMLVGLISLASSLEGYFLSRLNYFNRGIYLITAILLLYPSKIADTIGLILFSFCILTELISLRRSKKVDVPVANNP